MNRLAIATIGILLFAVAAPAQYYEIRDLGTLPNQISSAPSDINNAGTITGNSGNRAFMYKNCTMMDIGTLAGTQFSAEKISEEGQIVGFYRRMDGVKRAFSRTSSGIMVDAGGAANLEETATAIGGWGIPVGVESLAAGLNGNGVYYFGGTTYPLQKFYLDPTNPYSYGFVTSVADASENWRILGHLKAFGTDIGLISAPAFGAWTRIQGFYIPSNAPIIAARIQVFTTPKITASIRPKAMNRKGQIVGEAGDGLIRAFLSNDPTQPAIDLGSLGDDTQPTIANDINYNGWVVGLSFRSIASGPLAFLHDGVTMIDLNTRLLNGAGWQLTEATAINDTGQIVGIGIHNDQVHGFLLIPRTSGVLTYLPACSVVGNLPVLTRQ
ncbi:MAG TPA: hypothetical protein VE422_22890 [Terriglobia bacterium]|nr:hypothetical protein [Terriglobia bacterium]